MYKNIKKAISVIAIVMIVAALVLGAFSYFTDYAIVSTNVIAGTLDISITNVTEDLTAGLGIMNPGDSNDLTFTVNNDGSKSADVKPIITVTSSEVMSAGDHEWKVTDAAGNELPGELSADRKTLTYILDTLVLNGSVETEEGVTETSHTYNYKFVMDIDAPDTFQGATATADIEINAKQHRNTQGFEDSEWVGAPAPTLAANSSWFSQGGTSIDRSEITEIEIVDSIEDSANYASVASAVDTWDASDGMVGTVTAYAFDNGDDTYKLTIAGNGYGSIYANPDSSFAFSAPDTFENDTGFQIADSIQGISLLNTSKAQTMEAMFSCFDYSGVSESSSFTLDLSSWDTSSVTNMSHMFRNTGTDNEYFTLNLGNWDTSSVTDMSFMFCWAGQSQYSQEDFILEGLDEWDTSSVTDMSFMFNYAGSSTYIEHYYFNEDIAKWDTSSVTNMSHMFEGVFAYAGEGAEVVYIDLSNWDTSSVTDMSYMFSECGPTAREVFELNLTNWDTSKVTNMEGMFNYCGTYSANITLRGIENWDTSSVTDMSSMFSSMYEDPYGDRTPEFELDLSNWDTSSVTDMADMFGYNDLLKTIYVSDKWSTVKVGASDYMFDYCLNLVGGSGTVYSADHVDAAYAKIDGGTADPGYFTYKAVS